ncbi:tyrosine-type recombinase/integrase [Listeria grayi]|uniref:Tyr recombinase domain-containing protein n=1 Tax=Listeria grayi DSM 20601 TaxID=525367 RepID=D7V177_LISGR|nr:tyrosine-type recombinase/integrase [Listeria grayi]EFI83309.1 hypothetical protein HMPREF0556_11994 [Listeria grayi DSM 20601]
MRHIKNLKVEKTVIGTFTDKEVSARINAITGSTYSNIRDKMILLLLLDCGVRVTELISIKNADVNDNNILIHGKGSKERVIYIRARLKNTSLTLQTIFCLAKQLRK